MTRAPSGRVELNFFKLQRATMAYVYTMMISWYVCGEPLMVFLSVIKRLIVFFFRLSFPLHFLPLLRAAIVYCIMAFSSSTFFPFWRCKILYICSVPIYVQPFCALIGRLNCVMSWPTYVYIPVPMCINVTRYT